MNVRMVPAAAMVLAMGLTAGCSLIESRAQSRPLPDPPANLAGTSWQLARFAGADGTRPDDASRYTIAFGTDGRATVRADCNRGSGPWSSPAPGRLQLGPIATTRMGCPPGSQGDRFLRDLGTGGTYRMTSGELELASGPGGATLVLIPADR